MSQHLRHLASFLALMILTTLTTSCGELFLLGIVCVALCVSEVPEPYSDWQIIRHVYENNQETGERFVRNNESFKVQSAEWVKDGSAIKAADIWVSSAEEVTIYFYVDLVDLAIKLGRGEYFLKVRGSENEQWEDQVDCDHRCELSEELSQTVHKQLLTGENLEFSFYLEHNDEYIGNSTYRFSTGKHQGYGYTFNNL